MPPPSSPRASSASGRRWSTGTWSPTRAGSPSSTPGCPRYRPQLEPGLELLGRPASDIRAIVLTHSDGDHIGVAEQLRSELGVPVYVDPGDEATALKPKPKKTDGGFFPHLLHPTAYRLFWHLTLNGVKPKAIEEVTTYEQGAEVDVPGHPNRDPDARPHARARRPPLPLARGAVRRRRALHLEPDDRAAGLRSSSRGR